MCAARTLKEAGDCSSSSGGENAPLSRPPPSPYRPAGDSAGKSDNSGGGGGGTGAAAAAAATGPDYSALAARDWQLDPASLRILTRPDGSEWELGSGASGRVYKALLGDAQEVAVKVFLERLPVSAGPEDGGGDGDGGEDGEERDVAPAIVQRDKAELFRRGVGSHAASALALRKAL